MWVEIFQRSDSYKKECLHDNQRGIISTQFGPQFVEACTLFSLNR